MNSSFTVISIRKTVKEHMNYKKFPLFGISKSNNLHIERNCAKKKQLLERETTGC